MTRVLTSTEALPELEQLLRRRTALGLDHRDEMWEGVLHMVPPAGGPHQILSGRLQRVLGEHAEAVGLLMAPETGLFDPRDPENRWRVPDLVAARPEHWTHRGVEGPAALVVEILSPRDETFAKLPFYAEMGVAQILVVDPADLACSTHRLDGPGYRRDDDGVLDALGVQLDRRVDGQGPVLVVAGPDGRAEIRPWVLPDRPERD